MTLKSNSYNHWNRHIPRSQAALSPSHVRKQIGSQEYDGKSLKGKKGQKALLVAKVIGVGLGTLSLVLIPVFMKKKLYCKACVWIREVYYNQKLSIVHLKTKEVLALGSKDDSSSSGSINENAPFSDSRVQDIIPLILQNHKTFKNAELIHYLKSVRQVSKNFCHLIDTTVCWNLFNLGQLRLSNLNHIEDGDQLLNYIIQNRNKFKILDFSFQPHLESYYYISNLEIMRWDETHLSCIIDSQPDIHTLYVPYGSFSIDFVEKLAELKKLKQIRIRLKSTGLAKLAEKCPYLEEIYVDRFASIQSIKHLKHLKSLTVERLEQEDAEVLVQNHPSLEKLNIQSSSGIEAIFKLKQLKKLILHEGIEVDSSVFSSLTNLEHLEIYSRELKSIDGFLGLQKLKSLRLTSSNIADLSGLSVLKNLTTLEVFDAKKLNKLPVSMNGLETLILGSCPILETLSIEDFGKLKSLKIYDSHQLKIEDSFEEMPDLIELSLSCIKTIENFNSLNLAKDLRFLNLSNIEDLQSVHLDNLKNLQHLSIFNCNVEMSLLIENFTKLSCLTLLECPQLSVKGSFKALINLERLTLDSLKLVTNFSFSNQLRELRLSRIKQIEELNFNELCDLEELVISKCSKLKTIFIGGTAYLKNLEITLCKTAKIVGMLDHLQKAKRVFIDHHCQLSQNQINELKQLPLKEYQYAQFNSGCFQVV